MERLTITTAEVAELRRWLEDVLCLDEHGTAPDDLPAGVPACVDGSDRYRLAAPCGCELGVIHDHGHDPAPGWVRCAGGPLDGCDGWRTPWADAAWFDACPAHLDAAWGLVATLDEEAQAEAIEAVTGRRPWWDHLAVTWPALSDEAAAAVVRALSGR